MPHMGWTNVLSDQNIAQFNLTGGPKLRMYMPTKLDKCGIKLCAKCDGCSSYMSPFQLCIGKLDATEIQQEHGIGNK